MSGPTYTLLKPHVQTVEISPNPVSANTAYSLWVAVVEIEITITPTIRYCGTFYCGEEDIDGD